MTIPHIIHNEKNVSRHLHLLHQLTTQGIEDYILEPAQYLKAKKPKDAGRISVAEAHKRIVRNNYDKEIITIFEDDIVFTSKDSWKKYWEWFNELPEDWMIYSGGCYSFKSKEDYSDNLQFTRIGFGGLHCYTLRKPFYDKFLACPEDKHIDKWVGETGYKVYLPKLLPTRQMETFAEKDAKSERRGARCNYPSIRRKHKYLTD